VVNIKIYNGYFFNRVSVDIFEVRSSNSYVINETEPISYSFWVLKQMMLRMYGLSVDSCMMAWRPDSTESVLVFLSHYLVDSVNHSTT
jgi:hypothetical protein